MSERYWVFQNNQVVGPFGAEELILRFGFSAETLVCPEGRQGTDAGDWQRAGLVSPIADVLSRPKSSAIASPQPQAIPNPASGNESLIIKELSILGAVHEKIGALGQSVAQMQELAKRDREELSAFRSSFEEKDRQWSQWTSKLPIVEGAEAAVSLLKENIGKISSEFQSRLAASEEITRSQNRIVEELSQKIGFLAEEKQSSGGIDQKISELGARVDELASKMSGESQPSALSGALDEVKALVEGLRGEIAEIKSRQDQTRETPGAIPIVPSVPSSDIPVAQIPGTPSNFDFSPSPFAPPVSLPGAQEALNSPAPFEAASRFEPSASSGSVEFGAQASAPAASSPEFILPTMGGGLESSDLGTLPQGSETAFSPATLEGLAGANLNANDSLVEPVVPAPQSPKKTKKRAWVFIVLIAGGALAALAYVLGLIPGFSVSKPQPALSAPRLSPPSAASLPVPSQTQQTDEQVLPQGQEEAFKNSAIQLVQNWHVGNAGKNISQILGAPVVSPGGLSPWTAEKIKDNLYQVVYYAAPSGEGGAKSYEFQADLGLQKVVGQNQVAVDLLSAQSLPSPIAKKIVHKKVLPQHKPMRLKKKRAIKKSKVIKKVPPKKKGLMPGMPNSQSATKKAASSVDSSLPGYSQPMPPSAAASQSPAPTPAPANPSEDQAVDQLLKP